MAISSTSYIAGALVLIIASGFVLTSGESTNKDAPLTCANFSSSCAECLDPTQHKDLNCTYFTKLVETNVSLCGDGPPPAATEQNNAIINLRDCKNVDPTPNTTTTPPPSPPPTTNATTTTPTTTKPTTPTTAPTTPTTPSTTAAPVPTTTQTPNSTTTIPTTQSPNTTTTTASPPTTAAPSHGGGGMSWASFFGGIVFTAAISSVAYLVWRFYKARQERNYHTLTTNLI